MINISIVTPIYNRRQFKPLIINNLLRLDYDLTKLEYVMDDDSTEEDKFIKNEDEYNEFRHNIHPISFVYKHYKKKRSIGEKRNNLVKLSTHKLIANLDSDDLYLSDWLNHSLDVMKEHKAGLVGTNQMIFCFPLKDWLITAIQCDSKRMVHESGMLFTKKHWRACGGFIKNNAGEGVSMVDYMSDNKIAMTRVDKCLVCICHDDNTVCKDRFLEVQKLPELRLDEFDKQLILRCIQ